MELCNSRKWYNYEVRMIRNDKSISSYKDAQGFRKGNKKLDVAKINAVVYHYGWVKSPKQMMDKQKDIIKYYSADDEGIERYKASAEVFDFNDFELAKQQDLIQLFPQHLQLINELTRI